NPLGVQAATAEVIDNVPEPLPTNPSHYPWPPSAPPGPLKQRRPLFPTEFSGREVGVVRQRSPLSGGVRPHGRCLGVRSMKCGSGSERAVGRRYLGLARPLRGLPGEGSGGGGAGSGEGPEARVAPGSGARRAWLPSTGG